MNKRIQKKKNGKVALNVECIINKKVDIFIPSKYLRPKYIKSKRIKHIVVINNCHVVDFQLLESKYKNIHFMVREWDSEMSQQISNKKLSV